MNGMRSTGYRALSVLLSMALLGCTATEEGTTMGTVAGAGLGAGTGAIIGSATGNAGVGTAIGAGIGAPIGMAMGYAIGKANDAEKKAEAAQAAAAQAPATAYPPPPGGPAQQGIVRAQPVQKQVIYPCPACNTSVDITGFNVGDRVRCPVCGTQFTVPH
jgi:DNA-directed RNA polymerase subunit RPC12/RpoP